MITKEFINEWVEKQTPQILDDLIAITNIKSVAVFEEVPFIFSAKDSSFIYNYLNLIADEWSAKRDNYEFAIKGLVLSLMTELMNEAPRHYINRLRLQKACRLIFQDELHMKEIAALVGFTTLSSFNRNFRAILGCSPSEWKEQLHDNNEITEITSIDAGVATKIFIL